MKSFKEFISEISKERLGNYINAASSDKSHHAHEIGRVNQAAAERGADSGERAHRDYHNDKHKRRSGGIGLAVKKLTKEETISEVAAPRSELDKLVFAAHPVKTTEYPVPNAGERNVVTKKDKSRKADKTEPNEATGGLPASEDPLYEPQTLGSRQKIMQYFKYESVSFDETPIDEDINGTYRASFYGQLKRRIKKNIVPAKPATQKLTTTIDVDDPSKRKVNGNQQGIKGKDVEADDLAKKGAKKFFKAAVNEVSYDRLRSYMDKNDAEYERETSKDNPYDGNTRKRTNRKNGFDLATNKRTEKNVKVPARDE